MDGKGGSGGKWSQVRPTKWQERKTTCKDTHTHKHMFSEKGKEKSEEKKKGKMKIKVFEGK